MEERWCHRQESGIDHAALAEEFEALLDKAKDEETVHGFLEAHPQLLPDVGFFHNGPRGDLVVSKLPLGEDFICDFAFVTEDSQTLLFTCIEIESPAKRLFNKGAAFSRDYLDARQQIADWNGWAQQNMRQALRLFDRLGQWLSVERYSITLQCILVMGRRAEINTVKRRQRWAAENALRQASMNIMTYDRLVETARFGHRPWNKKMLVCHYADRALHVKRISE